MGKGLPWKSTWLVRLDNIAMRKESTKILSKKCCSDPEMKLKRSRELVGSSVDRPKERRNGGARRREMVGLGRVELPTNGLGNRCSIHLSYRPFGLFYRIQQSAWNWAKQHVRTSFRRGGCCLAARDGFRFAAVEDGNNILDVWNVR
jgi:hypothetical protein